MNKIPMPRMMVSPNMEPKDKRGQGVLEKEKDATERAYDSLVAREEHFITPGEKHGKTIIFSRATSTQLKAADVERRLGSGTMAKGLIEKNVKGMKLAPDKKQLLLDMMRARIKGQISHSSDTHFGVESIRQRGQALKINRLPVVKQVRFVEAADSFIPPRPPCSVELPPLPPDD